MTENIKLPSILSMSPLSFQSFSSFPACPKHKIYIFKQ